MFSEIAMLPQSLRRHLWQLVRCSVGAPALEGREGRLTTSIPTPAPPVLTHTSAARSAASAAAVCRAVCQCGPLIYRPPIRTVSTLPAACVR